MCSSDLLEELQRLTEGASVCNHLAQLWTPEMRQFLAGLLPQPASSEIEDATYRPAFKRVGRPQRTVKRRPLHTHRAFIEGQQQK